MRRTMLIVAAITSLAFLPVVAQAKKSVLSEQDQHRIVCVAQRDKAGNITSEKICQSGLYWEKAVRLAKTKPDQMGIEASRKAQYLAMAQLYRNEPSILGSISTMYRPK